MLMQCSLTTINCIQRKFATYLNVMARNQPQMWF